MKPVHLFRILRLSPLTLCCLVTAVMLFPVIFLQDRIFNSVWKRSSIRDKTNDVQQSLSSTVENSSTVIGTIHSIADLVGASGGNVNWVNDLLNTIGLNLTGQRPVEIRDDAPPIPLHLFQTDKIAPSEEYVMLWKKANPGLTYTFMDDKAGRKYLRAFWGDLYADAFDSIVLGAIRADFLRLCFIAHRGGFYADADACPSNVSLIEMREKRTSLIVSRQTLYYREGAHRRNKTAFWNAFFAAAPGHKVLMKLVQDALENILVRYADASGLDILSIAGPMLMTPLLQELGSFIVFKSDHWNSAYVYDPSGRERRKAAIVQCSGGRDNWMYRAANEPDYWMNKARKSGTYKACRTFQESLNGRALALHALFDRFGRGFLRPRQSRVMDEAEQLWAPVGCEQQLFDSSEICSILEKHYVRKILFVGDSLMRHLYLAFLLLVMWGNDKPFGIETAATLQPMEPWAPSSFQRGFNRAACTNYQVAKSTSATPCRHYFPRKTETLDPSRQNEMCHSNLRAEFVYGGTTETKDLTGTKEYPGIKTVDGSVDMVVIGFGIWYNFEPQDVFRELQKHVEEIRKRFGKATIFWMSNDARHRDDFAMQTNERVRELNKVIPEMLRRHGMDEIVVMDLFKVTYAMSAYDGTHYGPGVSSLKVLLLMQKLVETSVN